MDNLKRLYENVNIDDFSIKNSLGCYLKVKFNNKNYTGYIIGYIKNNILVKFDKSQEIWKVNINKNDYVFLPLEKNTYRISDKLLKSYKIKLRKTNYIKNVNSLAIRTEIKKIVRPSKKLSSSYNSNKINYYIRSLSKLYYDIDNNNVMNNDIINWITLIDKKLSK